jgi:hypothetical protein
MILTKEYRLVWDTVPGEIILYGQFSLDTQTETLKDAEDFDTQQELDDKIEELGYPLPCIDGCTDPNAQNFDPLATCDDGSCILPPGPPE